MKARSGELDSNELTGSGAVALPRGHAEHMAAQEKACKLDTFGLRRCLLNIESTTANESN